MAALHAEALGRGDALTVLYPFRQGFYSRLGYATVSRQRVITVHPRAIPTEWRDAAPGTVRRATGGDRRDILRVYRAAAATGTGFVTRPARAWEEDLLDERRHWLVLDSGGTVGGYVALRVHQSEPHARVHAEVLELVAPEDASRRRLLAAIGALGDQVGDLTMTQADDDPLDWAFTDGDRDRAGTAAIEHSQGVVNTGPMLRLADCAAALLARGYTTDGAVQLSIDDAPPFSLEVRGGVAKAVPAAGGPCLAMKSTTLASVAFGGLRLEDAARIGWVDRSQPALLREAAHLLRLPAFFTLDVF
jgi:predicted acetyltransferase